MKTKNQTHKPNYNRLLVAYKTSGGFYDFVFHLGYQQFVFPRWFRKLVARSELHRAWFSGFTGLGILSVLELKQSDDEQPAY